MAIVLLCNVGIREPGRFFLETSRQAYTSFTLLYVRKLRLEFKKLMKSEELEDYSCQGPKITVIL